MGLGAYKREDWSHYIKEFDFAHFPDIKMQMLGRHTGDCDQFAIDSDDFFSEVVLTHSPKAIHSVNFRSNLGKYFTSGSTLTD